MAEFTDELPPGVLRAEIAHCRAVIADVLCGQALADHLGDIRDEELHLWRLLGVDAPVSDHDSAWRNTRDTLRRAGIPLPDHLDGDDGDDDDD